MSLYQNTHVSACRRFTGILFSLALFGGGASFANAQRQPADRPAPERRTMDSPGMDRPTMDRPQVDRPVPDRPTTGGHTQEPQVRPRPVREQPVPDKNRTPPATTDIIVPRPMERCMHLPTERFWRSRDLMAEIRAMARRGLIAVHPIADDISEFTGYADLPAGWKAYGFRVPAGEKIHIRLSHANQGWFRLSMVDKWGGLEKGMLQNLIPTGNPEVSYTNFTKEPRSVYVIVDDPGWMSNKENPFTMKVDRSWNPAEKKMDAMPIATGIWAQR